MNGYDVTEEGEGQKRGKPCRKKRNDKRSDGEAPRGIIQTKNDEIMISKGHRPSDCLSISYGQPGK